MTIENGVCRRYIVILKRILLYFVNVLLVLVSVVLNRKLQYSSIARGDCRGKMLAGARIPSTFSQFWGLRWSCCSHVLCIKIHQSICHFRKKKTQRNFLGSGFLPSPDSLPFIFQTSQWHGAYECSSLNWKKPSNSSRNNFGKNTNKELVMTLRNIELLSFSV